MPRVGGIEAIRQIIAGQTPPKVLIFSASGARAADAALKAGAMGFVSKPKAFEQLPEAIHCVMAGNTYL